MSSEDGAARRRSRFTISVAAEIVNVHQQTLRHYERLGLIEPHRGRGEIRYFTANDIERIQQIRRLVDELGVNLAGVEVILNMRDQIESLRQEANATIAALREAHEQEVRRLKEIVWKLQSVRDEVAET